MSSGAIKTLVILIILIGAAPAAVLLFNAIRASDSGSLSGSSDDTDAIPTATPIPLVCSNRDKFELSSVTIQGAPDGNSASIVGEISNTCQSALGATVAGALRNTSGRRIIAVGKADVQLGVLGPGEATFFRIELGPDGVAAIKDGGVIPDVQTRVTVEKEESP
jgi:hypothetical protein